MVGKSRSRFCWLFRWRLRNCRGICGDFGVNGWRGRSYEMFLGIGTEIAMEEKDVGREVVGERRSGVEGPQLSAPDFFQSWHRLRTKVDQTKSVMQCTSPISFLFMYDNRKEVKTSFIKYFFSLSSTCIIFRVFDLVTCPFS